MRRRVGLPVMLVVIVTAVAGCGDDKTTSGPKAPAGVDLKPLPSPGSPGGDGKKATPGGKAAFD